MILTSGLSLFLQKACGTAFGQQTQGIRVLATGFAASKQPVNLKMVASLTNSSNFQLEQTNSLTDQCLSTGDTGLVQINLQVQWPQKRINILDVLKPTEDEIAKYYKKLSAEIDNDNDSFNGSDNNTNKFTFKSESRNNEEYDNDRDGESANSLKRNQKPSE